ncbi:hypothetical protein SAMN06272771_3294 [Streptomyces sp. Ag82_O1-12]|nr:hypothetical protein SAMN06272771_3294 [Streptomyces sp. Ag82_O1-12]SOD45943.1 hypothetical protein SAMN06272727_3291 [Streptomyces sp. Ag82_G6-1]
MTHDEQRGPTRERRAPSSLLTGPASLPVTPVPLLAHRAIRVLRSPR